MYSPPHGRSHVTRHNPQPHRCVHISAVQGGQVPNVVDDGMPVDFHVCYPTGNAASLEAATVNPCSSLQALLRPQHLSQYRVATQDTTGSEPWRRELAKLTRETFQHWQDRGISQQAESKQLEKLEATVMGMLCRILQTPDAGAVRSWLEAATARERELASDIIRSSIAYKDEYFAACPMDHGNLQDMTPRHQSQKAASTQLRRRSTMSSSPGAVNSGQQKLNRRSDSQQQQQQQQQQKQQQSESPGTLIVSSSACDAQEPVQQLQIPVPPAGKKTSRQPSPTVKNVHSVGGMVTGSKKTLRQPTGSPKRH